MAKYNLLTPEERLSILRPRIQGLERDHFAVSLDVQMGNEAQKGRLAEVQSQLDTLRKLEAENEAEAKAR